VARRPTARTENEELDALTDAVLLASRALVAVASRSIASVDEAVTLPQFRALVVLDGNGGRRRVGELAQELRISPSTATRLCDRLVRKRLVRRDVDPTNRREVEIALSSRGRDLVREVTERRRVEIASIMSKVPPAQRATIVDALTAFRDAAGEDPSLQTVPW
jgi:DNA-binding MarR family transcriptional regulator